MLNSSAGLTSVKQWCKQTLLFGHDPNAELLAILVVYFVQGILGLSRLAISFFLKDDLGLTPAQVSAMLGVAALPWMVKPLLGFISDGLPIFGYRRRPYLVLSGLMGMSAWLALATVVDTAWAATIAIAIGSLSVAISDVIADSLVVERARGESVSSTGSLQSLCWGTSALGGLITAYFSGSLLEQFSSQTLFAVTAAFPLIVSAIAWLITESPVESKSEWAVVRTQLQELRSAISQAAIWMPTVFIFLWQAMPTAESAFFFFTTNELGFEPEFLGRVRLVTSLASLLGIWLFQKFFKTVPFRQIFAWSTVISAVLGMTTLLLVTHANRALGIDDRWFSLGDSLILTVMGQIAYMPVLVLAARLCPPGVEATLFALLMSISNLAGVVSYESGAMIMHWLGIDEHNFTNLPLLVVITNATTLIPLVLIGWLPSDQNDLEQQREIHSPAHAGILDPELSLSKHMGQAFLPDFVPELVSQRSEAE
ncbi:MAG: folate/biopterin family MFS transporter [Cyanobacteria bacterium]|nr:folate/biopterin family MFS transporter [Cyanobacteriota bacterium]MDW8202617.1 folate/biopterin family MFS transporter [Cyanobacteriota bacterium SKYGB_h_bin112]